MDKPSTIIGRDRQWRLLQRFLSGAPGRDPLRLGLLSGRRRNGKTQMLLAACREAGGLYHVCVQDEGDRAARARFAASISEHVGLGTGTKTAEPEGWEQLLRSALESTARVAPAGCPPLVVIDEFPYALKEAPSLPSLIQHLYDDSQNQRGPGGRLILCGSALSVMHELLSGAKPLRGRAAMDMRLHPLDFRETAELWGVSEPEAALRLHAVVGGIPGYRALISDTPSSASDFDEWVIENLLEVDVGVFTRNEVDYLLREDPRITHRAAYFDILTAVANGATTPTSIGSAVGKKAEALRYPMGVLESAGYLARTRDLLRERKSTFTIPDPLILFDRMITGPRLGQLQLGRARQVWQTSVATFNSQILGPHFETLAREWVERFAPDELSREEGFGEVGVAHVHDNQGRAKHELDVIAVDGRTINFLGEAKATTRQRGPSDLERLDGVRAVLDRLGYYTSGTTIGIFSRTGFTLELERAAGSRSDVELVDLERLYGNE